VSGPGKPINSRQDGPVGEPVIDRGSRTGRRQELFLEVVEPLLKEEAMTDNRWAAAERLASGYGVTTDAILASAHVLIGTLDEIVETLLEQRATAGHLVYHGLRQGHASAGADRGSTRREMTAGGMPAAF
jgi:hypothetical protein